MPAIGLPEALTLLRTAILPILAIFLVVYLAVPLAIRHEHRTHRER
jgi:hypothetical protein